MRSHRGLQALFGSQGAAAKNDNALLVCFLGAFSASLCKLNRAQMNNEGFGGFPFSMVIAKVLFFFFAVTQPAASYNGGGGDKTAECSSWTNYTISSKCYLALTMAVNRIPARSIWGIKMDSYRRLPWVVW